MVALVLDFTQPKTMSNLWQRLTLSTMPLQAWRQSSWLYHLVGLLQTWRQSSVLMQWADGIGILIAAVIYAAAPFSFRSNDIFVAALLGSAGLYWMLLTVSDEIQSRSLRPGFTPIHLTLLAYWGIAAIATAFSPVKKAALTGFTKLTLYLLLFALLARLLRSPKLRSGLITLYLHVSLIVSVYGLRQWIFGAQALATWVDPESNMTKTTRVYSYLGNPNLLAGYLLPAVFLSMVAFFAWKGFGPKLLAGVMALVNTSVLVMTFSRGGWVGLVAGGFALLCLLCYWWSVRLPQPWKTIAVPVALGIVTMVLVVAVVAIEPLRDRVASIFAGRGDSSNNFRINVWESVREMIKDYPILGIGPGNQAFNLIYPLYQKPRFTALSAYSVPLEITLETGFIGATCFLWFLVTTLTHGWRHIQQLRASQDRDAYWLIGAIAVIVAMLAHGTVDTVWYRPEVNTIWWMAVAIVASYFSLPLSKQPSIG
jgi:putative inorganic carbon (hco3(-)) transporter